MKQPIFADAVIQSEFESEGIVKVPAFTGREIDNLRSLFTGLHPHWNDAMKHAYYVSVFGGDSAYRQNVFDSFLPLVKPALDKIFTNYKVTALMAQVKGTGNSSAVGIHQDLSIVDETKYWACTVWIPLMDSTVTNGAIYSLTKSQQLFRHFRAHTLDYQFGKVQDFIKANATCYPAQKGELLVFDPGNIHYSAPNNSDEARFSIAVSVVSADAPLQIGYLDNAANNNDIELYDVPDNFWYLYTDFIKERLERPAFGRFNRVLPNAVVKEYQPETFINDYARINQ